MKTLLSITVLLLVASTALAQGVTPRGYAGSDSGGSAVESFTPTMPSGVSNGDVCLAFIGTQTIQTIATPSNWTLSLGPVTWNTSESASVYSIVCAGGDCGTAPDFTTTVADVFTGAIACYKNVNQSTPIDKSADSVNTASTTSTAPSITPSSGNNADILVHAHMRAAVTATCSGLVHSAFYAGVDQFANQPGVCIFDWELPTSNVASGTATATITSSANIGISIALIPATIPAVYRHGVSTGDAGSGTSISVTLPAAISNNDTVIVSISHGAQETVTAPSGAGMSWNSILSQPGCSTSCNLDTFWETWLTGDSTSGMSFTWTTSAANGYIASTWTGAATAYSPIDVVGGLNNGATASTTLTAPGLTPINIGDAILYLFGTTSSNVGYSPPTLGFYTIADHGADSGFSSSSEYLNAANSALGAVTTTVNLAEKSVGQTIALIPAVDSTPTPTATPSPTPTPTPTATPTNTSTPTPTPTATATPTPSLTACTSYVNPGGAGFRVPAARNNGPCPNQVNW